MLLIFMRRYEVKKALDLLETVKHMMIENGLDAVPQSLIKKAIDKSIAQLEALETKSCEGCKHIHQGWWCNENGIKVNLDFCCNRYEPNDNL